MAGELDGKRIGFIGAGAMGEALAGGLVGAGVDPGRLIAADPDAERRKGFEERLGIRTTADNDEAVADRDAVVLAVKPDRIAEVLSGLRGGDLSRPLWVSIAAGVPLAGLGANLPADARVVRAMPNTPARVHAGATALVANERATPQDLALATALFAAVGDTWEAPEEDLLDAVTGLSGSGPAYVFVFVEALGDAGVAMGLPAEAARRLAAQTVFGAAKLVLESGHAPGDLKDQVTSPGGTTRAGLERLEAEGFRHAIAEAVAAATRRSRELRGA